MHNQLRKKLYQPKKGYPKTPHLAARLNRTSNFPGALVQWLKLLAWKVGDRGFEPHSGLQVSKKQNISSPLTRKKSILWGASVTTDSQGSNFESVSGGQCHLIHPTFLMGSSCPSLPYMCTNVA